MSQLAMDWVLEVSNWTLLGVALAAGMSAWFLYRIYHSEAGLKQSGRWALGLIRFIVLAAIGVLLLKPLLRQTTEEIERPIGVVLMDDSRSMTMSADSTELAANLREWTSGMRSALADAGLEAAIYRFSGDLVAEADDLTWTGERTDLGGALSAIKDRYAHRNIKGIVLVSDGRINRGVDPEYEAPGLGNIPLWTIGVGDTTDRADRWIAEVACNRVAYLGNAFPMEALVRFRGPVPEPLAVRVSQGDRLVAQERWVPNSTDDIQRFTWLLEATDLGTQRYDVSVSVGNDELLTQNNRAAVYVDVLEKQKTIAIAAHAPHPDLGHAIATLVAQEAYDVRVHYERLPHADWSDDLKAADALIVHDLEADSDWIQDILSSEAPVWWMATGSPSLAAFSSLQLGASFSSKGLTHRVYGAPTEGFTFFQWPADAARAFRSPPALLAPLGEWNLSPAWNPALQVTLGGLITKEPLLAFRTVSGERRWAISTGSGWWRWRMEEGITQPDAPVLSAWVTSTIQYLTSRSDVRRFRVNAPNRCASDDSFLMRAEIYDGALNPLSGANIQLYLTTPEGKELKGAFVESGNRYRLDWGKLAPGTYAWRAETLLEGELQSTTGEVVIESTSIEWTADRADHGLLLRLAERTGGQFIGTLSDDPSASPQSVVDRMVEAKGAQPVLFEEIKLQDAVELPSILVLLVILLSLEWIFRRRTIGY